MHRAAPTSCYNAVMPKRLCFVVCPLGDERTPTRFVADNLLDQVIKPALAKYNFEVERADLVPMPSPINDDIVRLLRTADLCIIDLSDNNANVMYECGRRHETGRPAICLRKKGDQSRPFDVAAFREISYDLSTPSSRKDCIDALQTYVDRFEHSGAFDPPAMDPTTAARISEWVAAHSLGATRGPQIDFASMNDDTLMDFLEKTIPLHHSGVVERFLTEGGLLIKNLLLHQRANYKDAVISVRTSKILPLPSIQRMQVAKDAIRAADGEIRAITILGHDQWHEYDPSYVETNLEAARSGHPIRRIVIIETDADATVPRKAVLKQERTAGIQLRYGRYEPVKTFLALHGLDDKLVNVLMVSDKLMTRSYTDANHHGELVLSRSAIGKQASTFDLVWEFLRHSQRDLDPLFEE